MTSCPLVTIPQAHHLSQKLRGTAQHVYQPPLYICPLDAFGTPTNAAIF